MKLKKDDTVLIISGKDRGKRGKIFQVFPKSSLLLIEGVNLRKKHQKPRKSGEKGQVILKPGPVSVSNAKLICPKCGKSTKVGYKILNEKKVRICKKCNQVI
jgi:large subunit ribosomal protein L24